MQSSHEGDIVIASEVPTVRRGRRRPSGRLTAALLAVPLAAALATASAAAASAAPPPGPAAGVTPGAVATNSSQYLFYTAGDGSVWQENVTSGGTTPAPLGGRLVSGPSATSDGTNIFVFGQGTDNQVWTKAGSGAWQPLGGVLTSKPAAVQDGISQAVFVRGTDGAVWERANTAGAAWGSWQKVGGQVLSGTGPTAAVLNGSTYVMVVGTDHQLYIEQVGATGFAPASGQTNASPALAAVPGTNGQPDALVGFAVGTDGHGYYHRFAASSPGWQSMGGAFSSGLGAAAAVRAAIPTTYTFGLGQAAPQVFEQTATWASYPPGGIGNWQPVTP